MCQANAEIVVLSQCKMCTVLCPSAVQKGMVTQGNIRKLRATAEMGRMRHSFKGTGILGKRGGEMFEFPHQEASLCPSCGTAGDFPALFTYGV